VIVEGVATTWDSSGRVNVAPLGPIVRDEPPTEWKEMIFRPFPGSKTYDNLQQTKEGVFHLTDDILLIVLAATGDVSPSLAPCEVLRGRRLVDCCRAIEFRVVDWDESGERPRAVGNVVHQAEGRPWGGFNRASHAVLEAAVLATRLHLTGKDYVQQELDRLRVVVEKTSSPGERPAEAFAFLVEYVKNWNEA